MKIYEKICVEKCELIKKLLLEGKTYKFIQNFAGCLAKMISNARKLSFNAETRRRQRCKRWAQNFSHRVEAKTKYWCSFLYDKKAFI